MIRKRRIIRDKQGDDEIMQSKVSRSGRRRRRRRRRRRGRGGRNMSNIKRNTRGWWRKRHIVMKIGKILIRMIMQTIRRARQNMK